MGTNSSTAEPAVLPHLITEEQLAERLGLTVGTLYRYRLRGIGPAFTKIGGGVWYREQDVDAWIVSNQKKPH